MRATLIALTLLAGCHHTSYVVGNAQPVAPSGGIQITASQSLAAAVLAGMTAVVAAQDIANPQPMPSFSFLFSDPTLPRPAVMAPERLVNEQDCTQPIDLTSGNLRCR